MAIEKKWPATGPYAVMATGSVDGALILSSALGLHVKQKIKLTDPFVPGELSLEIKRIIGPPLSNINQFPVILVGPTGTNIMTFSDVSMYGVDSVLYAPEQPRNTIPLQESDRAAFEEEPANAYREMIVDPYGNPATPANPVPTALFGTQITILNNLLAMQAASILPDTWLVNNEGFFVFDNEGNFIEAS